MLLIPELNFQFKSYKLMLILEKNTCNSTYFASFHFYTYIVELKVV